MVIDMWKYRYTALLLCTLAFFVTMVGRLAVSPLVPEITAEFEVSNAVIGIALTGMWLAYGLSQYPSGIFADRFGERVIILVAIGGTTVASLLIALSPVVGIFIVFTIVLGLAAGLHYSVATTLLAGIYDEIGTAIGIHNTGATIAGLVTPIVVTWVALRYGWRSAIATIAIVGVPVFILFHWRIRTTAPAHPETPLRERVSFESISGILSRPAIVFTLCIAVVGEFVWQGTASFLPTFLVDHRGYSITQAGTLFSVYFIAQGVSQIVVGIVTDRIGCDRTLIGCMLFGALGLALLVAGSGLGSVLLGVACLGMGMSFSPAVIPRFLHEMSDAEKTTGFGLIRTVYMILASLGSITTGLFADLFGWGISYSFLIGLLLLVSVAIIVNIIFDLGY
ncbi:MFS transporter [Natrialbaceae archaeon A-CW2]